MWKKCTALIKWLFQFQCMFVLFLYFCRNFLNSSFFTKQLPIYYHGTQHCMIFIDISLESGMANCIIDAFCVMKTCTLLLLWNLWACHAFWIGCKFLLGLLQYTCMYPATECIVVVDECCEIVTLFLIINPRHMIIW